MYKVTHKRLHDFTLIEFSLVLIFIGLVTGAMLVAWELLHIAKIRATVSQVEEYKNAVNGFLAKYNGLPGDLTKSSQSGLFTFTKSPAPGLGDGNGLIQGFPGGVPCTAPCVDYAVYGEAVSFWRHLSEAHLIDGQYGSTIVAATGAPSAADLKTPDAISSLLPRGRAGFHNYFRIVTRGDGTNYFMLFGINSIGSAGEVTRDASEGLTPREAQNIDAKMDDGLPLSGSVRAAGFNSLIPPAMTLDPSWMAVPHAGVCTTGAFFIDVVYSVQPEDIGNSAACGLHFMLK